MGLGDSSSNRKRNRERERERTNEREQDNARWSERGFISETESGAREKVDP